MALSERVFQLGLPTDFPEFFPPQLEQYRRSIAEGADAPDEYGVAYMLAATATAAGADVSACVQPGWCVRANMYLAIVGYKGSGKSTLAEKCFKPLVDHEEALRHAASRPVITCITQQCCGEDADSCGYDDGYGCEAESHAYDDGYGDDSCIVRRYFYYTESQCDGAEATDPCVLVNDCSGPAVTKLLDENPRQLLLNADELAGQFGRSGSPERSLLCELYDGRRRRRERASINRGSATLAAPYMSLIGSIQPDLLKALYNSRGDDGLLDRILLIGDGAMRPPGWPKNADDPVLNTAWSTAISRLFVIEKKASDVIGYQVESRFTPDAVAVCRGFLDRLKNLVVVIGTPNSQLGVVKKMLQHAVRLALLHRVLRWAAGEFGEYGPVGDVDADDAAVACEAALFFFGRWLVWRNELWGQAHPPLGGGLSMPPCDDPVLQALGKADADARRGVWVIERLVRLLRSREPDSVALNGLTETSAFAGLATEELQAAGEWLVGQGCAEWLCADRRAIRLLRTS